MRNMFLLGCFLSCILEKSNSKEKLEYLEKFMEDFD